MPECALDPGAGAAAMCWCQMRPWALWSLGRALAPLQGAPARSCALWSLGAVPLQGAAFQSLGAGAAAGRHSNGAGHKSFCNLG